MPSDPGVYLRLKAAIDATIANVTEKSLAATALADAYRTFRGEAERVAQSHDVEEEFARMFPAPSGGVRTATRGPSNLLAAAGHANEALSLLSRLSGWLDGFVQEVRLTAEADAYARARLEREAR